MAKASPQLQQLAFEALDLGFRCFSDDDRVPFALIVDEGGEGHLIDFRSAGGVIDGDHVTSVRQVIAKTFPKAQRYALVWDGYLTKEKVKQDAVFAEAGEHGSDEAFIFAQPYRQKNRRKTFEKIGDAVAVQLTRNLLKAQKRRK